MFKKAEFIIMQVAFETGVPVEMITKKGRSKNVAMAKHLVRWRLRKETDLSLREIDWCTGGSGKNHRIKMPTENW